MYPIQDSLEAYLPYLDIKERVVEVVTVPFMHLSVELLLIFMIMGEWEDVVSRVEYPQVVFIGITDSLVDE